MNFKNLLTTAITVFGVALSSSSTAQTYPNQPINLVVPYAAGGATDVIARLVSKDLSKNLSENIVVTNKPGAGTTIAAYEVAQAKPDGYTLFMTTAAQTISSSLYKNLKYNPEKDFTGISLVAKIPIVLVTSPQFKASDLSSYIKYAKDNPSKITVGSPGNGSPQHLAQAIFAERTGTELIHIPYKGDAPLINDLLSGEINSSFITLSSALPHIQSGKLKPIALANETRLNVISEVPTMTEAGVEKFNAATWFGLFGPANLSAEITNLLNKEINQISQQASFTEQINNMGGQVMNLSPTEFEQYLNAERELWSKAVKASGAQID